MNRTKITFAALATAAMLALSACTFAGIPTASAERANTPAEAVAAGGGPVGQAAPALTAPMQTGSSAQRGITVVGMGQASGAPDVANVTVGVETQSDNAQQAVADNRTKMTKLLQTLKGMGIADKDINTTNYSVYTEQRPNQAASESPTGAVVYRVNNQVSVTVRDVSKLGDLLDGVVTAGANNIYGVNFNVADASTLQQDARAKAMADAKARAESLAKLAGVSLGDVIGISEISGGGPVVMASAVQMSGGATPIQPGSLDVNMTVQVTYAIK